MATSGGGGGENIPELGFASNENCCLTKPLEGPLEMLGFRTSYSLPQQCQPQTHASEPIWAFCPCDGRRLPDGSM